MYIRRVTVLRSAEVALCIIVLLQSVNVISPSPFDRRLLVHLAFGAQQE